MPVTGPDEADFDAAHCQLMKMHLAGLAERATRAAAAAINLPRADTP
ncbi:hypothetical protein [Phaeovulum sp.]